MLYVPEGGSTVACIVGIDPGSNTLGVAKIDFNIDTFEIIQVSAKTYVADRMYTSAWIEENEGPRFARIKVLENAIYHFLVKWEPIGVATEAPFHNHLRPNAFGVLMEVMSGIRNAVNRFDRQMELQLIPPSNVKNAVGAAGNAKKEVVRREISRLLGKVLEFDIVHYDEHSLDAIAAAYARYTSYCDRIRLFELGYANR